MSVTLYFKPTGFMVIENGRPAAWELAPADAGKKFRLGGQRLIVLQWAKEEGNCEARHRNQP